MDTKTDPRQLAHDNFILLQDMVFTSGAGTNNPGGGGSRLSKRNGYKAYPIAINPVPSSSPLLFSNLQSSLNYAAKVFSYNNELLLNDQFNLYSFDFGNQGWNYKGRSTMVALSTSNIAQDNVTKSDMDCSIDTTSGIKVFAWQDGDFGSAVKFSIQDTISGQFIVNKALFGNAANYQTPRCVSISGQSWIFAVNSVDGKIYYQAIIGQALSGSATALITNLNATNQFYDVDINADAIYLSYYNTTPGITVDLLDNTLAVIASRTEISEVASNGLSFFGDGTNIWVVYNNGTDTKGFIFNNALSSTVLSPTIIDSSSTAAFVVNVTGTWSTTKSVAFIFYGVQHDDFVINFKTMTVTGTVAPTAATPAIPFIRSTSLVSKAFSVDGIAHVVVSVNSQLQPTYFLLNLYNLDNLVGLTPFGDVAANIAAKISADQGGVQNDTGFLCGVHNPSGRIWELALGLETNLGSNTTFSAQAGSQITISANVAPFENFYAPVGVIDCQFDFSLQNPDVQVLGNNAHIASGQLTIYDGGAVEEQNFHIYPEGSTAVIANTSGGLGSPDEDALYGYVFTYEWADNQAQLHRSSPSPVLSPVASSTFTYLFTLDDALTTVITVGSQYTNNGATFTLLTAGNPGDTTLNMSGSGAPTSSGTLAFSSGLGPSSITFSAELATAVSTTFPAGIVAGKVTLTIPTLRVTNKSGSAVNICIYRTLANQSVYFLDRTVTNDPTVDSVIVVSSQGDLTLQGNLQLYTTGELEDFAIPPVTALTTFKNRILAVLAEGTPALNFSKQVLPGFPVEFVPEFIQNIGTVAGALTAVAGMDDKIILFKSGLSVGPSILYIVGTGPAASGANNDFTDPLPVAVDCGCVDRSSIVLTGAGLIFKTNKGIYLLSRGLEATYIGAPVEFYNQFDVLSSQLIPNTTQVRFLLSNGQMLMYDYFYGKWAVFNTPAGISDCIFQGLHTYVTSTGQVYQEDPGSYFDGTTPIQQGFKTSALNLAGISGYERIYDFLLNYQLLSPCQIAVQVFYDYSAVAAQSATFTPGQRPDERIHTKRQLCSAMQIQVNEINTAGGAGFTMSSMTLGIGLKKGRRPIPGASAAGLA